jgi:hypothetical protein
MFPQYLCITVLPLAIFTFISVVFVSMTDLIMQPGLDFLWEGKIASFAFDLEGVFDLMMSLIKSMVLEVSAAQFASNLFDLVCQQMILETLDRFKTICAMMAFIGRSIPLDILFFGILVLESLEFS